MHFLHIADVHFGCELRNGSRQADIAARNNYMKKLTDTILAIHKEKRLDFILFTGDIAFSSSPNEYALAAQWLKEVLEDSRKQELAVVIMHHVPLGDIQQQGTINSCDYQIYSEPLSGKPDPYLQAVDAFIDGGGHFLTWVSGHSHYDGCGPLKAYPRQMTLTFENAHANDSWNDDTRRRGTKSQDSFNMLTFDLHDNCVKILRVGNDTDRMLSKKTTAIYKF